MRILHVTPFFGEQFGGTERYCYNLTRHLVRQGHNVDIFTAHTQPTSPSNQIIDGVTVYRFYTPTVFWNINPLVVMLPKLLKAKYDIIHIHSYLYLSSFQAILAKSIRSSISSYPPIVLHLHGGIGTPPIGTIRPARRAIKKIFDSTLGKLAMRQANRIIAQSNADANSATARYPFTKNRLTVIPHAIDLTPFPNLSPNQIDSNILLFVGDLEYWKGIPTLIQAMRMLKSRGEKIQLIMVGMGTLTPQLRRLSTPLNIKMMGQQPHTRIPGLMKDSFACVLPSLWEAIPTVGLEAMAAGTPFIGSNIGGIPEIIRHLETGLLIEPNSSESLVDAIQNLKDRNLRKNIRQSAYNLVNEKHSLEKATARIEAIYEEILRK